MNQPQLFNFNGQQIRTVTINGEPYFVGNDASRILGYSNYRNAISNHVNNEDKLRTRIEYAGQIREVTVITESGLYDLAIDASRQSKSEEVRKKARKFRHWVTSEVLPAIRKHGAYMTDAKAKAIITDKSSLADLLQQAADQLKAKDVQIAEMKPKALFADAVATSNSTILIGQLAKIMRQNGVDIGQNRLFAWMRSNGYLGTRGSNYNVPTQYAVERGLFKTKETVITHSDGHTTVNITTKVTGKGQQYFINKFLKK